jgi:quercetin dioxygenase-like cupin family protein
VPLTSEPHHHFAYGNEYVKLFKVEVPPHEATLLHQHDRDYLYITLGNAEVTSAVPGKPEAHLKLADGSVGFSRGGFAHVARTDGDTPFRNDTIELLQTQGELRNLCLQVVANEHAACPGTQTPGEATHTDWPEFETDETRVLLTRVLPHREVLVHDSQREELIVAVDEVVVAFAAGKGPERLLRPGDFVWLRQGGVARLMKNKSDKEARYITLELKPHPRSETLGKTGPIVGQPLKPPRRPPGR